MAVLPGPAAARSARQRIVVRPHWAEWLELGLLPFVGWYAAFIMCGIVRGGLPDARESLILGAVLSIVVGAVLVRAKLTQGYFTLDAMGLTIGRSASVRVHWEECRRCSRGCPASCPGS